MPVDIERVRVITDPLERARAADGQIDDLNELLRELSAAKGAALAELIDAGRGDELEALFGVSHSRLYDAVAKSVEGARTLDLDTAHGAVPEPVASDDNLG